MSGYQRIKELGSGYAGHVYLEFDSNLARHCAAKCIPLTSLPQGLNAADEARRMMQAAHENVVEVYSASEEGSSFVIRMEYLERGSLRDLYGGRPVPVGDAVYALEQACRGIAHLHANGLLHRDIKAANLLVSGSDVIKVSDFGLSCTATEVAAALPFGYETHLAPEAIRSPIGAFDELCDIYALGVTAYELLNGADHLVKRLNAETDIAEEIRVGRFPDREDWAPHVHASLRKVIRRSLHVVRSKRFETVSDFRRAVE